MTTHYRAAEPLGPLVSSHPVSGAKQGVLIGVGIFCLIVVADVLALPFVVPRELDWTLVAVCGAISVVFGWLAVSAFMHHARSRRLQADVFEGGLVLRKGQREHALRWDDVRSVGGLLWETPGSEIPEGPALWIDDRAGQRLALPSPARDPYTLGREIRRRTFEARLAEVKRSITSGERAPFGRCALDAQALFIDRESVDRRAVARAGLSSRWLEVRLTRGGKRLVPTEEVPNADVLLALLSA